MTQTKLFTDSDTLTNGDEYYSLADFRCEEYTTIQEVPDYTDFIDKVQNIERICHILDLLEVGENFSIHIGEPGPVTFTRKQ